MKTKQDFNQILDSLYNTIVNEMNRPDVYEEPDLTEEDIRQLQLFESINLKKYIGVK